MRVLSAAAVALGPQRVDQRGATAAASQLTAAQARQKQLRAAVTRGRVFLARVEAAQQAGRGYKRLNAMAGLWRRRNQLQDHELDDFDAEYDSAMYDAERRAITMRAQQATTFDGMVSTAFHGSL